MSYSAPVPVSNRMEPRFQRPGNEVDISYQCQKVWIFKIRPVFVLEAL